MSEKTIAAEVRNQIDAEIDNLISECICEPDVELSGAAAASIKGYWLGKAAGLLKLKKRLIQKNLGPVQIL